MNREQPVKTILILAANPKGTLPLRLDEEVREIKEGLQRSRHRDRFVVEYESAARPRDVRRSIFRVVRGLGENGKRTIALQPSIV